MSEENSAPDTPEARALRLFQALLADPKTRTQVREKTKELFPDSSFPEDHLNPTIQPLQDQMAALQEQNAALLKRLDDRDTQDREAAETRTLEQRLEAARSKYNLSGEGFDKMVERMKETGNVQDAEAAAAWVVQSMPPPEQPGPSWATTGFDFFADHEQAALESLHTDPMAYQDAQLLEFTKNPEKYVRETFGG